MKKIYRLYQDTQRGKKVNTIRVEEMDGGKVISSKRYPKKLYKKIENDKEELEKLVFRLNGRDKKKEEEEQIWKLGSTFINLKIKDKFKQFVINELSSEIEGKKYFNMFEKYSLAFLSSLSKDPLDWIRYQGDFKQHLLGIGKSNNTLKRIVRTTNLYLEFLSLEFPQEIPKFIFKPFKASDYKNNKAKRENKRESKYITEKDYKNINKRLPKELKSIVIISRNYGLRLAEALGLHSRQDDVIFEESLLIDRQLKSFTKDKRAVLGPTKSREERDIPHYFIKPDDLYDYIVYIQPISIWTASRRFSVLCKKLYDKGVISTTYTFHDLRHTYITDIAEKHGAYEAMTSAGHSRLSTTDGYIKKKRKAGKTPFKKAS